MIGSIKEDGISIDQMGKHLNWIAGFLGMNLQFLHQLERGKPFGQAQPHQLATAEIVVCLACRFGCSLLPGEE